MEQGDYQKRKKNQNSGPWLIAVGVVAEVDCCQLLVPEPDVLSYHQGAQADQIDATAGNNSFTAATTASLTGSDDPVDIQSFTHNSSHCQHVLQIGKRSNNIV